MIHNYFLRVLTRALFILQKRRLIGKYNEILSVINTNILIKEYIRMIYGNEAEARVILAKLKYGSVEAT